MRIALISFGFYEYTIDLANALSKSDQVILFIPSSIVDNYREYIANNIIISEFRKAKRMKYPTNSIYVLQIINRLRQYKPNIVHYQSSAYTWFDIWFPYLTKYSFVVTVHDPFPHFGKRKQFNVPYTNYLISKHATQVIVHGKTLKDSFSKQYSYAAADIHVIPVGVLSFYLHWQPSSLNEKRKVLFFGSIWPYKGLEYLIMAEPIISKEFSDIKIVIAGEGEDFKRYENYIVNKDKFEIYNYRIPNDLLGSLFQEATVVVLPYVEATQSGVIPIAWAFAKPVITTPVGAIPEVVDDGKTGILVPPKNVEGLANAVIDLLKNDDKRRTIGRNAYEKAFTEYSWDRIAEKHRQVYKKAMQKRC